MSAAPARRCDALVVGAGFFGASVALFLQKRGLSVLLVEREEALMTRASRQNQARVHAGYHYPRSLITALRSQVNFPRFVEEFRDCVVSDFPNYYGVARTGSKVSARQFTAFMGKVGAPLSPAPKAVTALFNPDLVEAVFTTREYAFDATRLARMMAAQLEEAKVPVLFGVEAERVARDGAVGLELTVRHRNSGERETFVAPAIYNCTYSQLNALTAASGLPVEPLRHELTEIALVEPPPVLGGGGITLMCGAFFSVMPFPFRKLHSFSHVRYTPHERWDERAPGDHRPPLSGAELARPSSFRYMQKDAQRFLPCLSECRYVDSLWEVKTVLPLSEVDDGRPILFRRSAEMPGLVHLMGGKIDNVFDVLQEITRA